MKPRFLRSDTVRLLRLGKKRRKLQKWRRPRGRHSKIRRKRVGYPVQPGIGYGSKLSIRGLIKGKEPVLVETLKQLNSLSKNNLVILSRRLGAKKRIEIVKHAHSKGLSIQGVKENTK